MTMRLLIPALLVSLACLAQPVRGQAPQVLKDSGIRKLAVFVGTWKAENAPDTNGVVGVSSIYTCQWAPNGNYLIADQRVTQDGHTTNNLSIYSYDPKDDSYLLSLVGIPGMQPFSIRIEYKGDELFYIGDYMDNGKKVYGRTVNTFLSPTHYTFKVQSSPDGVRWVTTMEGKAVKMKPPL